MTPTLLLEKGMLYKCPKCGQEDGTFSVESIQVVEKLYDQGNYPPPHGHGEPTGEKYPILTSSLVVSTMVASVICGKCSHLWRPAGR